MVALEGRTEGLSTQLSRMHDSLMRMSNHVAEVEGRLPRTAAAYKGPHSPPVDSCLTLFNRSSRYSANIGEVWRGVEHKVTQFSANRR